MNEKVPRHGAPEAPSPESRTATGALYGGFLLSGVVTTLLGPILPALASRWSLGDAQSGTLFMAQFLGNTLGATGSGALIARWGYRRTLGVSMLLTAAGVAGLGAAGHVLGLFCIALYGVGLGILIPATNLLVAATHPKRAAGALNFLNFCWGLGAVAWPLAAARFLLRGGPLQLLEPLAAVLAVWSAAYFCLRIEAPEPQLENAPAGHILQPDVGFFVLLGSMCFLYVGTENAFAGWIATYVKRLVSEPGQMWMAMPSYFWGALLAARLAAPWVLKHWAERTVVSAGLFGATAGSVVLLLSHSTAVMVSAIVLVGLGLGPVYPTLIAWMTQKRPHPLRHTASYIFAVSGLGGATLPLLVGVVAGRALSLRAGLAVVCASCFTLVVLELWISRRSRGLI